jgi:uncharacterized protein YneF (UPF0154 family)
MDDLPSKEVIIAIFVLAIIFGLALGFYTAPLTWIEDHYVWMQ